MSEYTIKLLYRSVLFIDFILCDKMQHAKIGADIYKIFAEMIRSISDFTVNFYHHKKYKVIMLVCLKLA